MTKRSPEEVAARDAEQDLRVKRGVQLLALAALLLAPTAMAGNDAAKPRSIDEAKIVEAGTGECDEVIEYTGPLGGRKLTIIDGMVRLTHGSDQVQFFIKDPINFGIIGWQSDVGCFGYYDPQFNRVLVVPGLPVQQDPHKWYMEVGIVGEPGKARLVGGGIEVGKLVVENHTTIDFGSATIDDNPFPTLTAATAG